MTRIALALLIYASLAWGQNWEYSSATLEPQPDIGAHSQFHILAYDSGRTAFACGMDWDWEIAGVYDSLGQRLWCQCSDYVFIESARAYALELIAKPGGFMALHYYWAPNFWGPSRAFGRKYGGAGPLYQTVNLYDSASAIAATYYGGDCIFLCASTTNVERFFIAGATDEENTWTLSLWTENFHDEPWAFCLATGQGVAYAGRRYINNMEFYEFTVVGANGTDVDNWPIDMDSLTAEIVMCADPQQGFWAISVRHTEGEEDEMLFYRSVSNSYYSQILNFTVPPMEFGVVPSIHAVPYGDGALVAGEASVAGTPCLFTAAISASGLIWLDTLMGHTRILDLSPFANGFTAAVRTDDSGPVELLRAHETSSTTPHFYPFTPNAFALSAYPNPFNAQTTITFDLPRAGDVTLKLFDVLGREIETLLNEPLAAGTHAHNLTASQLPSGVYFVKLSANSVTATHKLLLLK